MQPSRGTSNALAVCLQWFGSRAMPREASHLAKDANYHIGPVTYVATTLVVLQSRRNPDYAAWALSPPCAGACMRSRLVGARCGRAVDIVNAARRRVTFYFAARDAHGAAIHRSCLTQALRVSPNGLWPNVAWQAARVPGGVSQPATNSSHQNPLPHPPCRFQQRRKTLASCLKPPLGRPQGCNCMVEQRAMGLLLGSPRGTGEKIRT